MKKNIVIFTAAFIVCTISLFAQSSNKSCSITCNLTTANVCPESNTWKSNPAIYNDSELMTSLGYTKKGACWILNGNKTKTITGSSSKLKSWYNKLSKVFNTSKAGF